jgi:hypothetical protein
VVEKVVQLDFIKTLQTEAKSTADSYNQQTMGTLDYNRL